MAIFSRSLWLLATGWVAASCSTAGASDPTSPGNGGQAGSGQVSAAGRASSSAAGGTPTAQAGASSSAEAGRGGAAGTLIGSAGDESSGGASATNAGAAATAGTSGNSSAPCDDPRLVWKSANKTNYESYPAPGSPECVEFNGCTWAGQFAACDAKKEESWVMTHDIVAAFPDFQSLELHDLCLRKGDKTIVATVLDTCADSDCDGCCSQNLGSAAELIDVEKYTNQRWGVADGRIEWADLGPTRGAGCE
jgi:hypothetical protein